MGRIAHAAIAFSILVHTETTMQSGFFLTKKPLCTIFKWQHVNRKPSNGSNEAQSERQSPTPLPPISCETVRL
jgi:hypothetical protein